MATAVKDKKAKPAVKKTVIKPVVAEETVVVEKPADLPAEPANTTDFVWKRQEKKKKAGEIVETKCIVIDKYHNWNEGVKVNLQGADTSSFEFNSYGVKYPMLVEKDNKLAPYHPSDKTGESPNLLFIAAKTSNYKNYMKLPGDLLRKIQIGLMAGLVIGIMFLIYVLISR